MRQPPKQAWLRDTLKFKLGVILLVLFALIANLRLIKREGRRFYSPKYQTDEVAEYEKRFDGAKRILPPTGVIGYLTEGEEEVDRIRNFHLTQYALSPRIVVNDLRLPLILVDFPKKGGVETFREEEFILLEDFGNGVKVYKRKEE